MAGEAQQADRFYGGIDVGGTNFTAGVIDRQGTLLGVVKEETRAYEAEEEVVARFVDGIRHAASSGGLDLRHLAGVAVALPGLVDDERGEVEFITNFPGHWRGVPLRAMMEPELGVPVHLLNDVRAFTLGETAFGAGRGVRNVVGIAIGTGIGGGVVIDGKLHLGIQGSAGEVGHMTIVPNGPRCECGSFGCLEALASGPAIATMAIKAIKQGTATSMREMSGNDLNKVDTRLIAEAAAQGDAIAREIIHKAGEYLGLGISNLITVLSPDMVIVGGGVSLIGRPLFDAIEETVRRSVFLVPLDRVRIVPAELGTQAGVLGAAAWAMRHSGS